MIQFFAPDIETTLTLPESDSQHCVKVLRKQPGDLIEVIDGKGTRFTCRLMEAHQKRARIEILDQTPVPPFWNGKITIAVAPTKHLDRMEWLVEKLTETGFDTLIPLQCRWSERKEIKTERLEKIAVSAMKQSLKGILPEIASMTPFRKFIESCRDIPQKFIAHCDRETERHLLSTEYRPGTDTVIAIGPEGDFSPEEAAMALDAGFRPVSLGEARLRTETAALLACHTLHVVQELTNNQKQPD